MTPIISAQWSSDPAYKEEFDSLVKSSIAQDQWIVIEGVNSAEATTYIK